MRILFASAIALAAIACDSPPATQPQDFETVNATANTQPVAPGVPRPVAARRVRYPPLPREVRVVGGGTPPLTGTAVRITTRRLHAPPIT